MSFTTSINKIRSICFLVLAVVFVLNPIDAHARRNKAAPIINFEDEYVNKKPAINDVIWTCHWDGNEGILCSLFSAPENIIPVSVDSRLPESVVTIRNAPSTAANKTILIPIHSIPFDMQLTGTLADSVMCGSRDDCSVVFGKNHKQMKMEMARLLTDEKLLLASAESQ